MSDLKPDELDLLARLQEKKELEPYFFQRAKSLKWFMPLKDRGFFNAERFPAMQVEGGSVFVPHWPVVDYVANASCQLSEPHAAAVIPEFVELIRSVTIAARSSGLTNYRVWWALSRTIVNIPPQYLSVDDVSLVDYWLDDPVESGLTASELGERWLPRLLESRDAHVRDLAAAALATLFEVKVQADGERSERSVARLRMSDWQARQIVEQVAASAGSELADAGVRPFIAGLEVILQGVKNDRWSSIWRPSIEPHEQNLRSDDLEDVLIDGARLALTGMIASGDSRDLVRSLLSSRFQTLRRIAIWACTREFSRLSDVAQEVALEAEFFESNYRHEFWHFLAQRFDELDPSVRTEIIARIERIVVTDDDAENSKVATAYQRASWFAAIKGHGRQWEDVYQQYVRAAGVEPDHADFSSYSTSGSVVHKSEYSVGHLLSLGGGELASLLQAYLVAYKPRWGRDEEDLEGLAKTVRQMVKADPVGVTSRLKDLHAIDVVYIYEIIEGFSEMWNEKAKLPWDSVWGELLSLIESVIGRDGLFAEPVDRGLGFVATERWVVSSIGRLMEAACRSDEHAIDAKYHERVERVLVTILELQPGDTFSADSDAVTVAINSPRGQAIEALINLSLRICRACADDVACKEARWKGLRAHFDQALADEFSFEFPTLVARYLPNFVFMSSEWVDANFDVIFDHQSRLRWLCAMQGYACLTVVYDKLYRKIRDQGHIERALDDPALKDRVVEKIVQNIAVAYFNGWEDLDSGAMALLLQRSDASELRHLAWFVWTLRSDKGSRVRERVIPLWERLVALLDVQSEDGMRLASSLSSWISFVDEIDDVSAPLLAAVAPYCDYARNGYAFLEGVARLAQHQPMQAADLWMSMLRRSSVTYPEEAIRQGLDALLAQGVEGKRRAQEIASRYAEQGSHMPAKHLLSRG